MYQTGTTSSTYLVQTFFINIFHSDPEAAYDYTNKGNLVAVISNGTAVLGLGNIGALGKFLDL